MPLRFLVDESCDYMVVQALRQAGHDVLAVVESLRGAEDQQVAECAWQEKRIVITEDIKILDAWFMRSDKRKQVLCWCAFLPPVEPTCARHFSR